MQPQDLFFAPTLSHSDATTIVQLSCYHIQHQSLTFGSLRTLGILKEAIVETPARGTFAATAIEGHLVPLQRTLCRACKLLKVLVAMICILQKTKINKALGITKSKKKSSNQSILLFTCNECECPFLYVVTWSAGSVELYQDTHGIGRFKRCSGSTSVNRADLAVKTTKLIIFGVTKWEHDFFRILVLLLHRRELLYYHQIVRVYTAATSILTIDLRQTDGSGAMEDLHWYAAKAFRIWQVWYTIRVCRSSVVAMEKATYINENTTESDVQ